MATARVPDQYFAHLTSGYLGDQASATYKVALCLTAPVKATTSVLADITQISTTGGYSTGGESITLTWAETGAGTGIWQLGGTSSDCTFTPSGTYDDWRYAVLYQTNSTTVTNAVIAVLDYGSTVSGMTGPLTVDAGTDGWVQFTTPAWS